MTTEAQSKREERAAKKRQRELDKLLKERAKLSEMEQARLTVEAFENQIAVLLTVHRESSPTVDWLGVYAALPPFPNRNADPAKNEAQRTEWAKRHGLARGVLDGEPSAYIEALSGFSPFAELSALGESVSFRVESRSLMTCEVRVSGREAIPSESHSLSATGKLISKPMPKSRFHEIYQDYVCSSVLRVARETFALLPIHTLIVTAMVKVAKDDPVGEIEGSVLSVAITRKALEQIEFNTIDPSDTIESLPHRGDVLASKKSADFSFIVPLRQEDVEGPCPPVFGIEPLWTQAQAFRSRFQEALKSGKMANLAQQHPKP